MVPPQPSSRAVPHAPPMLEHVFGVQHMPETHLLVPEHEQSTLPQALLTVVPQAPLHVGSWQQALLTHVDPAGQLNVWEPQEFVTVPQYVELGCVGSAQHVPGSVVPAVEHAKPAPHEFAEQLLEPQELLTIVLHGAPSPPHVGSAQHVPGVLVSGCWHCEPEGQPQVRVPPQPSSTTPQAEPHALRAQHVPVLPAAFSEQTESPVQGQLRVPPQPSGNVPPHFPAYAALHVFGVQQVPPASHSPLFGHALVSLPPQPSSN